MAYGSFEGKQNGEYDGDSVVEISSIFVTQDTISFGTDALNGFSVGRCFPSHADR